MINLNNEIPGFANPKTKQQIMQQIDQYALSIGFSQKEIDSITDPRLIFLAYKAMNNKGNKDGGYITGPGTSRSDSIPRMLSNGEYVIKSSVVNALGKEFFDRLNNSVK